MAMVVETWKPEETFDLGKRLGQKASPGQVYCLEGELGVGKTVFAQGFAAGLGIGGPVNSPTFTILHIYEEGRMPLYHFDAYRIGNVEEMEEIGYQDYFYGDGACLVEWPRQIQALLPDGAVWVAIEKDLEKGFDYRRIQVDGKAY